MNKTLILSLIALSLMGCQSQNVIKGGTASAKTEVKFDNSETTTIEVNPPTKDQK